MTRQSHHIHPIAQMSFQNDWNHSTDSTNHQTSRRNAQTTRPTNCRNAQRCFQTGRNHSICDSTNHQTARMTHCCRTGFGRSSCCGDCSLL